MELDSCPFKLGEIVTVLPGLKDESENFHPSTGKYTFAATKEMLTYVGQSFRITRIEKAHYGYFIRLNYIHDSDKFNRPSWHYGPAYWNWTDRMVAKEISNKALATALLHQDDTLL